MRVRARLLLPRCARIWSATRKPSGPRTPRRRSPPSPLPSKRRVLRPPRPRLVAPAPSTESRPPRPRTDGAPAAKPRASFNPALQPREGGKPREIDIPGPPRVKPEGEAPKRTGRAVEATEEDEGRGGIKKGKPGTRTPQPKVDEKRERVKLTINNAFDEKQRERSLASLKRRREREKLKAMGISQPRDKIMREVVIPEVITIQELANRMTERAVDVIKYLMKQGEMHKINDVVDADTAELIVQRVRPHAQARVRSRRRERASSARRTTRACSCRAPLSSPSWATSTTARRRCSTPSGRPTSSRARRAASRSTSAPIR